MFNASQFAQDANEATPPNESFGKLKITQSYKVFNGKGVPPTEVTRAEYDAADPHNRAIDATFELDASEINPAQTFTYVRKVRLGSKDWRKTVAPSLIAVFGSLANLRDGAWVEVQDVPQIDKKEFSVPKFLRVFGSKEECAAAWAARYQPKRKTADAGISADILETLRGAWTAVNKDETLFRQIVSQDPKLASYDPDKLLAALSK